MSSGASKTVILIPTYNESKNLPNLLQRITAKTTADVLIIDDNSPDKTGELAEQLRAAYPCLHVLHRPKKEGLGIAYKDGFRWAFAGRYDIIVMMDADLSHDPDVLPVFLEKIKDYDAVFGSRYLKGVRVYNWSFKRLLLSKFSNKFIQSMLHMNSTDTTTAYKCFRRPVLESIQLDNLKCRQNAFLIELVYQTIKSGFRTTEIPFLFSEREEGESKMRVSVAAESLFTVFKLCFWRTAMRWKLERKKVAASKLKFR